MKIWDVNPVDNTVVDSAGRDCPLDPMTGEPKVPRGAMTEPPPEFGEHEAARVAGGGWEVVPDWRGHVYWSADGQRHEIEELGTEPPTDALPEAPKKSVAERVADAKRAVDVAAGDARARFISPGMLIDAEYVQAEEGARAFADAGYTGAVPSSVQSWADATGMTTQEAADDILATAQRWRDLLDQIRAVRLSGKAAIEAAAEADLQATAQTFIDQLKAIKPA